MIKLESITNRTNLLFSSFNVAIKCLKKKIHDFVEEIPGRQRTDTEGTSGVSSMGPSSYDSDNKDVDDSNWTTNDDIEALIDEAKTMISLGSYHENIVNLQGVSYEVDHKYDTLKQVFSSRTPRLASLLGVAILSFYYVMIFLIIVINLIFSFL